MIEAVSQRFVITANAALIKVERSLLCPVVRAPEWRGCLHLLAEGALLARHPDDIVGQLLPGYPLTKTFPERVDAKRHWSEEAALALSAIGDEGVSSDGVATRTGLQADARMRILAALELAGALAERADMVRTSAY